MERQRTETPLAYWRRRRGFTQDEMVRATGLSRATYGRLEQGRMDNPPLRYLANCAYILRVPMSELFQPEWKRWYVTGGVTGPPAWAREKVLKAIADDDAQRLDS